MPNLNNGFMALGKNVRRVGVHLNDALAGFSACDDKAPFHQEAYLSAFAFGRGLIEYLKRQGTTKGYFGECAAPWVWIDVDRANLSDALADTRKLVAAVLRLAPDLDQSDLLLFFSGRKGFHVGIPASGFPAATEFNHTAKRFALLIAEEAGVKVDESVYDKSRIFRAPNSVHPDTGLRKIRLSHAELFDLSADLIRALAASPKPFELPTPRENSPGLIRLWLTAERDFQLLNAPEENDGNGQARPLQRFTLDFLHYVHVPLPGERARTVFRVAANLAELGCPDRLVSELLYRPGRDCGLSEPEVARQVECGIAHARQRKVGGE